MITINLLPEEFRVTDTVKKKPPVLLIVGVVGGLFAILTVFFYIDYLISGAKLHGLEKDWVAKQPQFQQLTSLKNDVEGKFYQEKLFMERFVTTQRPLTNMLTWMSEALPETAWLTNVIMTREEDLEKLVLQGLILPGQHKSSIELIEKYMQDLKERMPDANLAALTTTRQKYEGVSVTQFVANFTWGNQ